MSSQEKYVDASLIFGMDCLKTEGLMVDELNRNMVYDKLGNLKRTLTMKNVYVCLVLDIYSVSFTKEKLSILNSFSAPNCWETFSMN